VIPAVLASLTQQGVKESAHLSFAREASLTRPNHPFTIKDQVKGYSPDVVSSVDFAVGQENHRGCGILLEKGSYPESLGINVDHHDLNALVLVIGLNLL